jgi:hypothetical protein
MANILYRRNKFSKHFMQALVQKDAGSYIRKRLNYNFASEAEATIFYYFVGALVANLGSVEKFNDAKAFLGHIEYLAELELDECYLYILEGLAFYGAAFRQHNYQVFATSILKKCEGYCRNRKSRFVTKYLDVVASFVQGEFRALETVEEEKRKKTAG